MLDGTILVCDDDAYVHKSLEGYLKERNLSMVSAYDGETALSLIKAGGIDLVLLDIMLPGISGMQVLSEISGKYDVAVIMLSAKGEEIDRVLGLELGADDYVTKPFSPREVAIRIKKLLNRRSGSTAMKVLRFADLSINVDTYTVTIGDERMDATPREVELLSYMVYNAGKVLSREMILSSVWGIEYTGDTRCVDASIKRIRAKLAPMAPRFAIKSVYGIGYKLEQT